MSRLTSRLSGVTYVVESDTSGRATCLARPHSVVVPRVAKFARLADQEIPLQMLWLVAGSAR